jgi:hemerythrin-like domain-containing protein
MATLQGSSIASIACMEHQILDHVKQALRVTINWEAPVVSMPRKLSSLQFTIKSFKRHFDRVMSVEEEGGYMNEVIESKPYLQNRIENLEREHNVFRARLKTLIPQLNGIKEWEEPRFEQVCQDLRQLLDDVDRHDLAESELLQESLMMDDGGEG